MYSWPVLLLLFILSVILIGLIPTISGVAFYYLYQIIWTPALVVIGVLLIVLFSLSLYSLRGSITGVLLGFGSLAIVAVGWILSRFGRLARILGYLFPITRFFDGFIARYPGTIFMEKVREDFVSRATIYIENGIVEVEESSEDLVQQARNHYDRAGLSLSNGEAVLAIVLAFLTLSPRPVYGINIPTWSTGALSIVFVVVVALRLSVLKALLFSDISINNNQNELLIMRDWNQGVAENAFGFWRIATFRATWSISEAAYDFYLDWAFHGSIVERGKTKLDAASDLWKPLVAFVLAESAGIGYREASKRWIGEDVFTTEEYPHLRFAEGEYAKQLAAEGVEEQETDRE